MALKGKPWVADLTVAEMTETQFQEFRDAWIHTYAIEFMEDGVTRELAILTATNDFDRLCKKSNGFQNRDAAVLRNRKLRVAELEQRIAEEKLLCG